MSIIFDLSIKFKDENWYSFKGLHTRGWSNIDKDSTMGWPYYSRSMKEAQDRNFPGVDSKKLYTRRSRQLRKFVRRHLKNV